MNHQSSFYRNNYKYSRFLESHRIEGYRLYLDTILSLISENSKFLDVGCGVGTVVDYISRRGVDADGIEVSKSSLQVASNKKGKYYWFDGIKIPFKNGEYDVVGSFNVLEHVDNVENFLNEMLRVTKKGGCLIVACPNFLSITNSYHHRTAGIKRKLLNLQIIIQKLINLIIGTSVKWGKFNQIKGKTFQPDDDAINLTNPTDLIKWGLINKAKIVKFIGTEYQPLGLKSFFINIPLVSLLLGSSLLIFEKDNQIVL